MAEDASLIELAGRLRALRADAGLTLRELSRKAHISDSSLSRYFTAQALPPWEVVEVLADLAGADQVELRQSWESAAETRNRSRWSGQNESPDERPPVPLWEPEGHREISAAPAGTGRRVGLFAGVVMLVSAALATGWLLHGEHGGAIPATVTRLPEVPSTAHPLPLFPRQTAASVRATTGVRPVALPTAATASRTVSPTYTPTQYGPSPSPTPAPTSTSSPPLLSGTLVSLTNNDSSTNSVPFVMDLANWSTDDGAPVHLWSRRTDPDYRNQLWTAEKVTSGNWRFVNLYSGKCLDRDADGNLFQSGCAADTRQEWSFSSEEIRSVVDGRCIEIEGHQRLMGANLRMTACDGGWYQLWHPEQRTVG